MTSTALVPYDGPVFLQGNRGTLARTGTGPDGRGNDADRLAARRELISELHLQGYSYVQIGATVGIGKSQVGREIAKIRDLWAERTAANMQHRIDEEDAKLDLLERIAFRAAADDAKYVPAALAVMARRAALHGFDKPTKIEHSGEIEVAQKQQRAVELADELERKRLQRAG